MTSTEIKSGYLSDFSVYTLGTNSGTSLGSIPNDVNIIKNYTVLVNDALHWSAARPGSFVENKFFSFKMKDDSFQVLPYPVGINYEYPNYVTFGELGGLLSMYHAPRNGFIEVWVMKEYGVVDSWTKQFRFEPPEAAVSFYFMKPLGLADNGEIMIMENGGRIILYNPRTNTSRMHRKFDFEFDDVYCYAKSIVSPRLANEVNSPQI